MHLFFPLNWLGFWAPMTKEKEVEDMMNKEEKGGGGEVSLVIILLICIFYFLTWVWVVQVHV